MDFELYEQNPSAYYLLFLISIIFTVLLYCTFPLLFAKFKKNKITKKKYRWVCYGVNMGIMLLYAFLLGAIPSGAPYLLWTWIFSSLGIKILSKRGLIVDEEQQKADCENEKNKLPNMEPEFTEDIISELRETPEKDDETVIPEPWKTTTDSEKVRSEEPVTISNEALDIHRTAVENRENQHIISRKYWITMGVLVVLLVAAIWGDIYGACSYRNAVEVVNRQNDRIVGLQGDIGKKKTQLNDLQEQFNNAKRQVDIKSKTIQEKNKEISRLRKKVDEYADKAYFLDKHVVIEADDGTHLYHSYDCPYLDLSYGFWAYNIESAPYNGGRPCRHCQK